MSMEMRVRVQKTALSSYNDKLVAGTSGNVSEFDHQTQIMAITPTNLDYRELTPEQVVLMKTDGEIISGDLQPSSEWRMHAAIYNLMPHINAVIHTHSPRATSFAVLHEKIPLILIEMLPFIGGDIPLAPFCIPGTAEVGIEAVKVMVNRNACLLANHGVLVVGDTLSQAYLRALYVEDAATIYHYAKQLGQVHLVPDSAVKIMKEKYNLK